MNLFARDISDVQAFGAIQQVNFFDRMIIILQVDQESAGKSNLTDINDICKCRLIIDEDVLFYGKTLTSATVQGIMLAIGTFHQ